jgi:hypothetical protein
LSVDDRTLDVVGCSLVSRDRTRPYTIIKDMSQLVAKLELRELISSLVQCHCDVHRHCDTDLFRWETIGSGRLVVLQVSRSARPAVSEAYNKKLLVSTEGKLSSNMAVGVKFAFVEVMTNGVSHIGAPLLFFKLPIAGKLQQWVWIKTLRLHLESSDGRVYTWSGGPSAMLVQAIQQWLPVLPLSNDKFIVVNEPIALNTANARVLAAASATIKAATVPPPPVATAVSTTTAAAPGPPLQQPLQEPQRKPSRLIGLPSSAMQQHMDTAKQSTSNKWLARNRPSAEMQERIEAAKKRRKMRNVRT